MDRVFESGALGTPPSAPGSPSTGYATSGNPATSTPATKPGPWWYHMITEELRNVVNDAGLTPDHLALNQLSQAIQALASSVEIRRISATVAANALTISASGLSVDFRSTTLGSGVVTKVSGTPANLVISAGSTLGTVNNVKHRLAVLALNNGGVIELAVVNTAGATKLDETGVISTTAEGGAGAADSATVVYSTTARSNLAYRLLGYIESTQTTAGTWASAPSAIQGAGGLSDVSIALNAGGSAPMFACRAWVNFNGTSTLAINASGNVSSVTDNGTGDYTINFTSAMPDANYAVCGFTVGYGNTGYVLYNVAYMPPSGNAAGQLPQTKTTSAARVMHGQATAAVFADSADCSVMVFR